MRFRTLALTTGALTAALVVAGCTSPTTPAPASPALEDLGHVHGIVDTGDGTVLLGTHTGLYTLTEDGAVAGPVGGHDFDAMGLTRAGDVFYASGHPGPTTPPELGAPHLGVLRSTDAGRSWEPVAFTGQEDFHVLTASGAGAIYGIGSSSSTVRTSPDGGATWIDGAELPAADLAVAADGILYAATQQGVQESRDAGATFTAVPDAPLLYMLEADPGGGVAGVDTEGSLWRLIDGSWTRLGTTTGTVQALGATADGAIVLLDDRGIVWIRGTESTTVLPASAS